MRIALAIAGLLVMSGVATAENLETTHLFGFTLGTDVNNVGEVEGELETIGRFGKSDGAYKVLSPTLGLKFIPFQNFSIEPGVGVDYYKISSVPGSKTDSNWGSIDYRLNFGIASSIVGKRHSVSLSALTLTGAVSTTSAVNRSDSTVSIFW